MLGRSWIVLDNGLPVRYYEKRDTYEQGQYADVFDSYSQAQSVRREVRAKYFELANAAPGIESYEFKANIAAADKVKIIRIED